MRIGWVGLAAIAAAGIGCPKHSSGGGGGGGGATPAATVTQSDMAPTPLGSIALTEPTPSGKVEPMTITVHWSGGLSTIQWYDMTIQSDDTSKIVFKTKPLRGDEKTITDTLDAAQTRELRDLFDQVHFDDVQMVPRRVKILDIGETVITRDMAGKKKEVREDPGTAVSTDIHPLRQWLDQRTRTYLEKAGVLAKPRASPTPT